MRYTGGDILNRVYSRLENNSLLYPAAELYTAITEALRVLNLYCGTNQLTATVSPTTQANRLIYPVPSTVVVPLAVWLGNRQLGRCSLKAMDLHWRDWMRHTSANRGQVAHWVPLGIREFAIHPADATGGGTLKVTGIAELAAITQASDAISLPEEWVDSLTELASNILTLKEGGAVFAASAALYQKFLSRSKDWMRWQTLKQPRFFLEAKAPKEG